MNSKEYWAAREKEQLKHYLRDEEEYNRQIKQIYSDMLDGVQREIDGFYGRYASKEGISINEAKKRVSRLDMDAYERKAKRYVKEKNFSGEANEEMRLYNATMKINRLELLKANIGLELITGHDELNRFMGDVLKGRTEAELKRQAGILGKTVLNNAEKAHAIPGASFHNATFSDRIWMYQDLMKADLSKLLQRGMIQGRNSRVLARELQKYVLGDAKGKGGAVYNTERLMRSEMARVQTEAQRQSYMANGLEEYRFVVNGGCCDICKALDNKPFKVADMMPGENAPPMHPHCRCSTGKVIDRETFDQWLDYVEKGGSQTFEEWKRLKKSGKSVAKPGESGIINSGGISGAKKTPGWQDRHAEREYASIRKRTTDCNKIAKNTGLPLENIKMIKRHMFIEEHLFRDGSKRRFDADYDQSQAWDRLSHGNYTRTDVLLLKHELEEARLMREQKLTYEEAHEIANQKYNWWEAFLKEE